MQAFVEIARRNGKRLLLLSALLLLAAGTFQPFFFRIFTLDRARLTAGLTGLQYRRTPGLYAFMTQAATRIPRGARATLIVEPMTWQWYEFVYARSLYPLAGVTLRPLIDEKGSVVTSTNEIEYLLVWRSAARPTGFDVVWSTPDGALMRRKM